MAVEEHRRIALHRAATESWGEENADTLVDLVTPAGHEMATKADIQTVLSALDALDERWEARFAAMEARLDAMGGRLDAMDERWEERLSAMNDRWATQLEATEHRLTATFERGLRDAVTTQTRVLVISVLVAVMTRRADRRGRRLTRPRCGIVEPRPEVHFTFVPRTAARGSTCAQSRRTSIPGGLATPRCGN